MTTNLYRMRKATSHASCPGTSFGPAESDAELGSRNRMDTRGIGRVYRGGVGQPACVPVAIFIADRAASTAAQRNSMAQARGNKKAARRRARKRESRLTCRLSFPSSRRAFPSASFPAFSYLPSFCPYLSTWRSPLAMGLSRCEMYCSAGSPPSGRGKIGAVTAQPSNIDRFMEGEVQ